MPLAVVAIGGNSLAQASQVGTISEQYENATLTCRQIAKLIQAGFRVVLTHGNGPQVGNALRRVELSEEQVYPLPLDICVADTQGGIGYMLQQVLTNVLRELRIEHPVASIVTQVLVDPNDPAFKNPTKPIGSFLNAETAERRRKEGWVLAEDAGRGFRRVVPSPTPKKILEVGAVQACLNAGYTPIAAGGGGVPVIEASEGLRGVAAVVDKDLASALLAQALSADLLVISTGVEQVQVNFGKPDARALNRATSNELRAYAEAGQFPAGSMGPKVAAALQFLAAGGERVVITDPEHLFDGAQGRAGTQINR